MIVLTVALSIHQKKVVFGIKVSVFNLRLYQYLQIGLRDLLNVKMSSILRQEYILIVITLIQQHFLFMQIYLKVMEDMEPPILIVFGK